MKRRVFVLLAFVFFSIILFYFVSAVNINSCTSLDSGGVYTLTQNVFSVNSCMNITASNVTLNCNGFTIKYGVSGVGSIYGINMTGPLLNVTIKNCTIVGNSSAGTSAHNIYLSHVNNSLIENNKINTTNANGATGIYLYNSSMNNITMNNLSFGPSLTAGGFIGIFLQSSDYNNITGNNLSSPVFSWALWLNSSGNNLFEGNSILFYLGGSASPWGVSIHNSSNNTLLDNKIVMTGADGATGIYLLNSKNNTLSYNNVSMSSTGTGSNAPVYLNLNSTNNTFSFNNLTSIIGTNNWGIQIAQSASNAFINNSISVNGTPSFGVSTSYGVNFIDDSDFNLLSNNTISTHGGMDSHAIFFNCAANSICNNNNITLNTFRNVNGSHLYLDGGGNSNYVAELYIVDQYIGNYTFNITTDYTTNFFVRDSNFGEVRFLSAGGWGANLSNDIRIKNNSIVVESGSNGELNKSANVTFYGMSSNLPIPVVLRGDTEICPSGVCVNLSVSNGVAKFNVTSFSNYTVDSYPSVAVRSPIATTYAISGSLTIDVNEHETGVCRYSLDSGATNSTLTANSSTTGFSASRAFSNGAYSFRAYCNDSAGLMNNSLIVNFTVNVPAASTGGSPGGGSSASSSGSSSSGESVLLCSSNWQCSSWGACFNGISTRECTDSNGCGTSSGEPETSSECLSEECVPDIKCESFGECGYLGSAGDVFSGSGLTGSIKDRLCYDTNECIFAYTEDQQCTPLDRGREIPLYEIKMSVESSGEQNIVVVSSDTKNPVARIDLDALRKGRLRVSFMQGNKSYSSSCFNAVRDNGEESVDCGGGCIRCQAEGYDFNSWQIFSLIIFILFIIILLVSRNKRFRV